MPYANMELFTDLPHFIHNQRSVLFVAHKAITDQLAKYRRDLIREQNHNNETNLTISSL